MTDLKGYIALITGASSGMGNEMAKALLEKGATVVIAARGGAKLEKAYESLKAQWSEVHAVELDVRSEESVDKAVEWFKAQFDHLDMLVNNAGIGSNAPGMEKLPEGYHFYDIPVETVRAVVETNFVGYFMVTSKFVPIMVEKGHGSVVYVSTSDSTMTRRGQLPYGPSKAGAEAMTKIMADELKELGIMVNIICPSGFTDTGMAGAGVKDYFLKNNLPILPPTVLNKPILFLASPQSEGLTGQKLIGKDFDLQKHKRV